MSILGTKKNTKIKTDRVESEKVILKEESKMPQLLNYSVILMPRITEKAGDLSQKSNAYTFEIIPSASKDDVIRAVKSIYKVAPIKVNIINLPRKRIFSRGKKGWSGGVKKAVVYLKKDDKIEFI